MLLWERQLQRSLFPNYGEEENRTHVNYKGNYLNIQKVFSNIAKTKLETSYRLSLLRKYSVKNSQKRLV